MTYELWTDADIEHIKEHTQGMSQEAKEVANKIIEMIKEANNRHHVKMLEAEVKCQDRIIAIQQEDQNGHQIRRKKGKV